MGRSPSRAMISSAVILVLASWPADGAHQHPVQQRIKHDGRHRRIGRAPEDRIGAAKSLAASSGMGLAGPHAGQDHRGVEQASIQLSPAMKR
jgi:hypothetical protein